MVSAIFIQGGDGICFAYGRDAVAGEYVIETKAQQWSEGWNPKFYRDSNGNFEARPVAEIDAVKAAELAEAGANDNRVEEIKTAKEAGGLKEYTLEQAYRYIDNQLDAATTARETKEAIRTILKRMVPYLLN